MENFDLRKKLSFMKDEMELKTKTKNLTYKSFQRQQYKYELPATLARIILKATLSIIDVKMNYKLKYVNNWKCRLCSTEEECYSHIFTCKEYGEDIKDTTKELNGLDPNCIFGEKHRRLQQSCSVHIKGIRNLGGESYQ